MGRFLVVTYKLSGQLFPHARIRVLNAVGTDVTPLLVGYSPAYTDTYGRLEIDFPGSGPLPLGTYTIQGLAAGQQPFEVLTSLTYPEGFRGDGSFAVIMIPLEAGEGYTLVNRPPAYCSTLAAVPFVVQTPPQNAGQWELIRSVLTGNGSVSLHEARVDADAEAYINLKSRLRLGVRPFLVPDGELAVVDGDFSAVVTVSFASITESGTVALTLPDETLAVANIYPVSRSGDLSAFTPDNETGLARWIVGDTPLTVFPGYYYDVMLWLPGLTGPYHLVMQERQGDTLLTTQTLLLPAAVIDTGRVFRLRPPTPTRSDADRLHLTVTAAGVTVTEPLDILLQHG